MHRESSYVRRRLSIGAWFAASLFAAGCSSTSDAGTPDAAPSDTGLDTGGHDATVDGTSDSGHDVGIEAASDTGTAHDATTDAAPESAVDAATDTATESSVDAAADSGAEAGADAASDAGADAGADAGSDAATTPAVAHGLLATEIASTPRVLAFSVDATNEHVAAPPAYDNVANLIGLAVPNGGAFAVVMDDAGLLTYDLRKHDGSMTSLGRGFSQTAGMEIVSTRDGAHVISLFSTGSNSPMPYDVEVHGVSSTGTLTETFHEHFLPTGTGDQAVVDPNGHFVLERLSGVWQVVTNGAGGARVVAPHTLPATSPCSLALLSTTGTFAVCAKSGTTSQSVYAYAIDPSAGIDAWSTTAIGTIGTNETMLGSSADLDRLVVGTGASYLATDALGRFLWTYDSVAKSLRSYRIDATAKTLAPVGAAVVIGALPGVHVSPDAGMLVLTMSSPRQLGYVPVADDGTLGAFHGFTPAELQLTDATYEVEWSAFDPTSRAFFITAGNTNRAMISFTYTAGPSSTLTPVHATVFDYFFARDLTPVAY
jgi:hypothetical protein